jgi:regulatory protein
MIITDIKQQIKRQDRYSIYVDEQYVFSLSEGELLSLGLHIRQELTVAELAQLKKTAIEDKAYTRSLDLLARRARSEWELRDYLRRKEYEPDVIEKTIQHLRNRGYVDDYKFAESWVATRRLLKATSQRKLSLELKQKRIADDIIQQVLSEDETDERQVLRDLVAKKRTQTRYQDEQKLLAYLMRQGFSYDDVRSVLRNADS